MNLQIALRMAKASESAYCDDLDAKLKYEDLDFVGHKMFDIDGAQCHAVWNNEEFGCRVNYSRPQTIWC